MQYKGDPQENQLTGPKAQEAIAVSTQEAESMNSMVKVTQEKAKEMVWVFHQPLKVCQPQIPVPEKH